MQTNWFIIGIVTIIAIVLVIYLIVRNLKDKKEVTDFFNRQQNHLSDEESELNDQI